tara:strand:- start:391 stop:2262 length:1872 start_codon:yes stop_codon:yes gene_type:complete
MAILAPSTPSDFGNEIDDLSEAYSPQQLQQKYAITKELKYLLALQKVTSIVQEAQRSLAASQEQTEGNVKDQLERGLMERAEDVIGLLGQPQGQTQMVAQGGIVGYSNGGDVEEDVVEVDEKGFLEQAGSDVWNWAKENPGDAALLGFTLAGGPGTWLVRGGISAFRALRGLNAADVARKANQVKEIAKSTVSKKKEVPQFADDVGDGTVIGNIPKQTGIKTTREFSPGRATALGGTAYATKQGIEALLDDEEESSGDQGAANQGNQGNQGNQEPINQNQGSTDDFNDLGILASRELPDYRGQAQQSADTVEDIAGGTDVYDLIKGRAFKNTSDVAQEGAEAYMERAGETGIRENLVELFKEADADLAALNNPEEMARDLRIATFANVGGTGVGQIFGNMSKSFLETKAAQKELLRAAIEKRTGNALKVIELDRDLFMKSEDAGAALYQASEAAKSEALTNISSFSQARKKQVVDIANSLRRSDDARVSNILEAIKQEGATLERRGRADLTSYAAASKQLDAIDKLRAEAYTAALATNPRYVELLQEKQILQAEGETLTTEELTELKTIKDDIEAAIYGILSQAGLLNGEEAAKQIMAEKNPSLISDREDRFTTYRRKALGSI